MIGKKRAPKRGRESQSGTGFSSLTMMHLEVIADVKQVAIDEHRATWEYDGAGREGVLEA